MKKIVILISLFVLFSCQNNNTSEVNDSISESSSYQTTFREPISIKDTSSESISISESASISESSNSSTSTSENESAGDGFYPDISFN